MDRPMTTEELFNKICDVLKEKGMFPDILDYALPGDRPFPVTNRNFSIRNNLDYGASEGIYLDLWLMEIREGKERLRDFGTIKTLKEDRDAMRTMGVLLADFMAEGQRYVREHSDDFTWEGINVYAFGDTGEKANWHYCFATVEEAMGKKDELLKKHGRIAVRDNATREETVYEAAR